MEPNKIHLNRYNNFIKSREYREIPEGTYIETHHIIPKSFGGSNEKENLIVLTAREHFIAHMILWKCFGGKMTYAFNMMLTYSSYHKRNPSLTSRQYEKIKKEVSELIRSQRKGKPIEEVYSKEALDNIANTKRKWVTDGNNNKMIKIEDLDNFLIQNPQYRLGHFLHTEETKKKISEGHKGKKREDMYGNNNVSHRPEVKEKIQENRVGFKHKQQAKDKISKERKGRKWINKNGVNKIVKPHDLDYYTNNGWSIGRDKKVNRKKEI